MHLLKTSNDETFSLETFTDTNVPPYAILSHTWGPWKDELTYQDIKEKTGKDKAGMQKLLFCNNQTREHGLEYFWVDTCCINKTDGPELSEAIISMYRWYQRASRCYVYLTDVQYLSGALVTPAWESEFFNSRWFTRGWTLQELIAPMKVEFYSKEGMPLGDKRTHADVIHNITGIDPGVLKDGDLSKFAVEERMSWSRTRETTRPEDIAYCLIGICGVSIAILYGEGREMAMHRLAEAVRGTAKPNPDLTIKAAGRTLVMPFERNKHFIARQGELDQLMSTLFQAGSTSKAAICALGGMGKTQLAIELVHRSMDKYKRLSVFWMQSTDAKSLDQAYLAVANELKILPPEQSENKGEDMLKFNRKRFNNRGSAQKRVIEKKFDDKRMDENRLAIDIFDAKVVEAKEVDVKRLVQSYLSSEAAGQWLLVFDNADDLDMWTTKTAQNSGSHRHTFSKYLPKSANGSILFTTRDKRVADSLARNGMLELSEMPSDAAIRLLQSNIPESSRESQESLSTLAEHLTYLPLAMVQASAYINQTGTSIKDYLSLFCGQNDDTIKLLSEDFEVESRYESVKNPVASTWLISFEQIQSSNSLAAEYLSIMACIEPTDIPRSVLPSRSSKKEENDAIGLLVAYSLVKKRSDTATYDLHRLVRLATRNWLVGKGQLFQSVQSTLTAVLQGLPDQNGEESTLRLIPYMPHIKCVLDLDAENKCTEARLDLMARYSILLLYFSERGDEARALVRELFVSGESILGLSDPKTLEYATMFVSLYKLLQPQSQEAEEVCQRVLSISEVPSHHRLWFLLSLAGLLDTRGQSAEAKTFKSHGTDLIRFSLGNGATEEFLSMFLDVFIRPLQGEDRDEEVESWLLKGLEASRKTLGGEHSLTIEMMTELRFPLWELGRQEEAIEVLKQVLEIKHGLHENEDLLSLKTMDDLATMLESSGIDRKDEAEQLRVSLVEKCHKVLSRDHLKTLEYESNLAKLWGNRGRLERAEQLQTQVIHTTERVCGPDSKETLKSIRDLVDIINRPDRFEEAVKEMKKYIQRVQRAYGVDSTEFLKANVQLAEVLVKQGRCEEALAQDPQLVEGYITIYDMFHEDPLQALESSARRLERLDRDENALARYEQCIEGFTSMHGLVHKDTLRVLQRSALILRGLDCHEEALARYEQCIEGYTSMHGLVHKDTLWVLQCSAFILRGLDRDEEALARFEQCIEGYTSMYGLVHKDTLLALSMSTNILASLARNEEALARYEKALARYEQCIEGFTSMHGLVHEDTLQALSMSANILASLARDEEALARYEQCIEGYTSMHGLVHKDTLQALSMSANILASLARKEEALARYRQCVEGFTTLHGPIHEETLGSLESMLRVLGKLDREEEALSQYEELIEKFVQLQGSDGENTLIAMRNQSLLLLRVGRIEEAFPIFEHAVNGLRRIGRWDDDDDDKLGIWVKETMDELRKSCANESNTNSTTCGSQEHASETDISCQGEDRSETPQESHIEQSQVSTVASSWAQAFNNFVKYLY